MSIPGLDIIGSYLTSEELSDRLPPLPNIGDKVIMKGADRILKGEVGRVSVVTYATDFDPDAFVGLKDGSSVHIRYVRHDHSVASAPESYGVLTVVDGKILYFKSSAPDDFIPGEPVEIDREIGIRPLQQAGLLRSKMPYEDFIAGLELEPKSGQFCVEETPNGVRLKNIIHWKPAHAEELRMVQSVLAEKSQQATI